MQEFSTEKINFKSLGLKCGLEIHQQLDTGRKLFCFCKPELQTGKPTAKILRYMRPTLSELGEIDKAAMMEFNKRKSIIYEIFDTTCTYEVDETPPFELDSNAVDLALTIAKLFDMEILDELHINRKQYLDGSIPSGFQRTMIVGINGKVTVNEKKVKLKMLALEEDSCREISDDGKKITWRLDRLGTPLVEIATDIIEVDKPEEVKEIAEVIGRILRVTGKVKRGLGTIRQDLNISISQGARVEIKGIQNLDMLPDFVKMEVIRQIALLNIKSELEKRNISSTEINKKFIECTNIFKKTKSKLIKRALKNNDKLYGLKVAGFADLLGKKVQRERSFGKELADRVKIIVGLGGILHTDELPNYGISNEEVEIIRNFFDCKKQDAVIMIICKEKDIQLAINEIVARLKEAFSGVPKETRHALNDGTTSFRRYLGGAGRMYPDTDSFPIVITKSRIKTIENNLPEMPEIKEKRYKEELKLPDEIAKKLAISEHASLFDELVTMGIEPILAAVTLEQTLKALARDKVPINNITENKIKEIFTALLEGTIVKEAIKPLLIYFANHPNFMMIEAMKKLAIEKISVMELDEIIIKILDQNSKFIKKQKRRALGKIMGEVMENVRGKIDGKVVSTRVKNSFLLRLKELKLSE